ncbi:MAG: DEAD/DEAH box helicase [Candidatus Accumulibacter sp.]|jgi:non-specific serine/threonine protein kinase|nr:DEAD/DEAH box helicase [Accumulibacter sp.]
MAKQAPSRNYELVAVFTRSGFRVEKDATEARDFWCDEALARGFESRPFETLYDFGFSGRAAHMSPSMGFLKQLAERFVHELSRDGDLALTRRAARPEAQVFAELRQESPYAIGAEYIDDAWLRNVWWQLSDIFDAEFAAFSGTPEEYFKSKNPVLNTVGRVFFHLVEHKTEDYPFAFLATYSTTSGKKKDAVAHLPLKNALLENKGDQARLLSLLATVSRAADRSAFISELTESGELFSPLGFTAKDAYTFLKEMPLYEECGIVCRMPDWWKKKAGARAVLSIGGKKPATLGVEALIAFDPAIYLDDMEIGRDEAEKILAMSEGLSFIKGKWVELDHEKLRAALNAFDKARQMEGMSFAEAMRLQMGLSDLAAQFGGGVEVSHGEWLNAIRAKLLNPSGDGGLAPGKDFCAALRGYQQTGLNWLGSMKELGFGALLADDMGLGKTVQVLALLDALREKSGGKKRSREGGSSGIKSLLVVPASLLPNWRSEAEKFAPRLKISIIHPGSREGSREFSLDDADLFITTYGMAARLESLAEPAWDLLILDEAQAIKNHASRQSKAVKNLRAAARIAMTGTPVENRLSDLWSIFDFLNKGFLGTSKEFSDFAKKLSENGTGYGKLRETIGPFILRRLKTDKAIISDLPDKVEMRAFASLTRKQVVLYEALVRDMAAALRNEDIEPIARRGLVLAGIMKFKQICNHPDQYLGQGAFDARHGGKFELLAEICETIREKRERVLVFTQFREIADPLARFLETIFERRGLVLHGGTPVARRGDLVKTFNGDDYVPFMVLSLKAGGVGLNLTAANHVVHFDRWWNPAIENQATDRAFRIGQQKNVMVHKFVTTGTIEEKIDNMLEEKRKLADEVVSASAGEKWITEMSNAELMNLFTLEA